MKRKERRRLKTNELSDFINKAYDFLKQRAKQVAVVIGTVALVFFIFLIVKYIQGQNLQKQSQMLAQINEINQGLYENPEKIEDLKQLAGKGKFTRMGYIYIAKYHIQKQEFEPALNALSSIPDAPQDLIYHQSQLLKAKIFQEQGELDKALEIYQKMEQSQPRFLAMDIILFHQAELYEEKGNSEKAMELYQKISEDYPQTYYGYEASQKIEKQGMLR
ncbi:MAG: tetratricopeptide repeat protein [Candidatus Aminicenantes bacterium]|nr:tetratricopeptide repeat protein [Candidatus Aminicenantes bacterium]